MPAIRKDFRIQDSSQPASHSRRDERIVRDIVGLNEDPSAIAFRLNSIPLCTSDSLC